MEQRKPYEIVGERLINWLFHIYADAVEEMVRKEGVVGVRRMGEGVETIKFYQIGTKELPHRVSCRGEGGVAFSVPGSGYIQVKLLSFIVFSILPEKLPPYLWSDVTFHSIELQVTDVLFPTYRLSLTAKGEPLSISPKRWGLSGSDFLQENLPPTQVIQQHLGAALNPVVDTVVDALHTLAQMHKVEDILPWWNGVKRDWDEFLLGIAGIVEDEVREKFGVEFWIKPHPLPYGGIHVEPGQGLARFSLCLKGNTILNGYVHQGNRDVNLSKVNFSPLVDVYKLKLSLSLPMPDTHLYEDITFSVTDDYISEDGRHHTSVVFHAWLSIVRQGGFENLVVDWERRMSEELLKRIEGETKKRDVIVQEVKEHMMSTYTFLINTALKSRLLTS